MNKMNRSIYDEDTDEDEIGEQGCLSEKHIFQGISVF